MPTIHKAGTHLRKRLCCLFCLAALCAYAAVAGAAQMDEEQAASLGAMIGKPAPAWAPAGWVSGGPRDIADFRGKVILLRFFSDQPAGAAALHELYTTYKAQGLAVIGLYVPTMPGDADLATVRRMADSLEFDFPVGLDSQWATVNSYWLDRPDADPAAVTFLIDRRGVIRFIQPDGNYEKDSRNRGTRKAYELLDKQIQALLKEAPPK